MPLAIITGANRGLGLEFARQYADAGWDIVAINRRSSDDLEALVDAGKATVIEANLTNDDSLANAVAQIDADKVDLLINNAGTMGDGSFADLGLEYQAFGTFNRDEWMRVFDVNVCTPQALTELLVDKLEAADRGVVVTISSMLGSNGLNNFGNSYAYRASKAAVNSIMKSMGVNLASRGIIAIALHPGWVRTNLGGPDGELDPAESVAACIKVINGLTPKDGGRFLGFHGKDLPW